MRASPAGRAHSAIYFPLGLCRQSELAGWGFLIVFKPQLAPLNCPSLSLCPFPNPAGKNNCPLAPGGGAEWDTLFCGGGVVAYSRG